MSRKCKQYCFCSAQPRRKQNIREEQPQRFVELEARETIRVKQRLEARRAQGIIEAQPSANFPCI
jgi:hypothetical protein